MRIIILNFFKMGCLGLMLLLAQFVMAAPQGEQDIGNYKLFYSVFNSTFLSPEMAQAYQIKRSAKEVVINVSVLEKSTGKPVSATITGIAKNLIQQEKPLTFREIKEEDALYSIAIMRTTEKEVFHFLLHVQPAGGQTFDIKFTQELFVNP